jgi:TonB-linked SusC/RagA family outer membrane protein
MKLNVRKLFKGFSFVCLFLVSTVTFAQSKTITGKVTDDKGTALSASIVVKGGNGGTETNAEGNFSITVPSSASALIFSSVGYELQTVKITASTTLSIVLKLTGDQLGEIVVIGYGTARKKDVTGAVTSVKAKDFNQGVIAAPDQLLVNKVAGLEVSSSSGQPGSANTIKIRGNSSILAGVSQPLFVVDGVPLDGRDATPALNLGSNNLPFGSTPNSNPLTYINPADIASIDVLKDASSAAIYGSRGANGVIAITTKKGTAGATRLDFGTSVGVNTGWMKTDDLLTASQFRTKLTQYNLTGKGYDSLGNVDALKAITQNTLSQNYNLALSGGNENGRFRASFLASSSKGYIKTTDLDKYIATFGGNYKFLDKRLTIDFNLIAGHVQTDQSLITNTAGAGGNLMQWVLNWNPTYSFYNPDGSFRSLAASTPNPLAALEAYSDRSLVNTVLGNISATVKVAKGLDYKFLYAINNGAGTRYTNYDGWMAGVNPISGSGLGVIGNATITTQTFTNTLNYQVDLTQKLKLEALAGYEYWKSDYYDQSLVGIGYDINSTLATRVSIKNTDEIINASTLNVANKNPQNPTTEIQSYFGRVNFNMSDKYYLTGTFRADGSNKFGVNNKYGYFPSVGAKWVISNEDFLKNSSVFSNLAVRASWGITGDQSFPSGAAQAQFAPSQNGAISQINVANPNLKWQQTDAYDFAVDYSLLKGRIYGSLDYYHKNTTNIAYITSAIQPAPSGNEYLNLPASAINSGVEFNVGASVVEHKDFSWDLAFNIAYNKNLLQNFTGATILTGTINGNGLSNTFAQVIANNQPINEFYMPHFLGYTSQGLDSVTSDYRYVGDPNPHVLLGFSTTFRYKKLSLIINMGGAFGYKVFNNTAIAVTNIGLFSKGQNVSNSAFASGESINNGTVFSDKYLESGNFLKLRNATFSYSFGNVGKYVKNLNAFVTGTNLFVITKFTGFDPEVNIDKQNNGFASRSIEYLPYPTARVITFGVNLSL